MAENIPTPTETAPSLDDLMLRYARGDDAAFPELHRQLSPVLERYLRRFCRDGALAEDVLQNTFSKLHGHRERYRPGSSVASWAKVIARRTLIDELRGPALKREVLDGGQSLIGEPASAANVDSLADVRTALGQLPEHYRSAVQLTKLLGLSGDEAARHFHITHSALKVRVHRGLAMLRAFLDGSAAPA